MPVRRVNRLRTSRRPTGRRRIVGFVAATIALGVGLFSTGVSAHVTVDSLGVAEQGGFAKIGFSVPNERDDAGTVSLTVRMPTDHPLVFVSVQPKPGWDVVTTMRTLDTPIEAFGATISEVVDTVSWTATGETQIGPGQFDQFWISAGAMPTDVDELGFPAIQIYSSGEEVAWIEPTPASGEEPELPMPMLGLVAPAVEGDAGTESVPSGSVATGSVATGVDGASSDDGSDTLAVVALIVGGLGLLVGAVGVTMARKAERRPMPV